MLVNPKNDWYTDTMRVCRETNERDGAVTRTKRVEIMSGVPCRIYDGGKLNLKPGDTGASVGGNVKLACSNDIDLHEGDEVWITRGGRLGHKNSEQRYYAGCPAKYYEPFGGVNAGLAHAEVPLYAAERGKRI
jgi:hypothetical protein